MQTGIVELTQDNISSGVYNKVFTETEDKVIEYPYETVLYENASGLYVDTDYVDADLNISKSNQFSAIVIEWAPSTKYYIEANSNAHPQLHQNQVLKVNHSPCIWHSTIIIPVSVLRTYR